MGNIYWIPMMCWAQHGFCHAMYNTHSIFTMILRNNYHYLHFRDKIINSLGLIDNIGDLNLDLSPLYLFYTVQKRHSTVVTGIDLPMRVEKLDPAIY